MKNIKAIFPIFWLLVLLGLGSYYIWGAEHESVYSEEENRMLAGFPSIKEAVAKGSLDADVEKYFLDHFPGRNKVISSSNYIRDIISIATLEDYKQVSGEKGDNLDTGVDDDLIKDLLNVSSTPRPTATVNTPKPTQAGEMSPSPSLSGPTDTPTPTVPIEYPPIEPKPEANLNDFAEALSTYITIDGVKHELSSNKSNSSFYKRNSVVAFTRVLNKYASILPKDGKLMFTLVPSSANATGSFNAKKECIMYEEAIPVINAFGADNVYAFDAGNILSLHMNKGEYIYFTSDMHWTPYGSYLLYKEMVQRAGGVAADYESDFNHTTEYPFLGTYYRDNPKDYMKKNPDTLELLEPKFGHELRRITGKDKYKVIPYLDFNAKSNDRYTVYLGGPAGPWTYVECDNDATENCLVIMDSFGLGYFTYLTQNYKQVHYYDPRYFDKGVVGYSVSEMISKYNIQDIYVVVGDLHSFNSSFILENANNQFE